MNSGVETNRSDGPPAKKLRPQLIDSKRSNIAKDDGMSWSGLKVCQVSVHWEYDVVSVLVLSHCHVISITGICLADTLVR